MTFLRARHRSSVRLAASLLSVAGARPTYILNADVRRILEEAKSLRPLIAALLLLATASALSLVLIPRFEVLQVDAVADPALATLAAPGGSPVWLPVGGGRIEPVPGGVRITNGDPEGFAGVEQVLEIPEGATGYRVTATVELEDVVSGPEPWQRAWVLVSGIHPDRQPSLSGPLLVDAEGSFGPRRLSAVFWLGQGVDQAVLMLRLHRSAGVMEVSDLEVEAVLKPAAREVLRPTLIAVWLAVGGGIGLVLWWQSHNRVAATLVLAGLGLMAVLMLLPNSVRQPLHQLLYDMAGGQQQLALLKPVLHLAAFALLAMASRLAQPQRPLPFFAACWLAAAVLLELAELLFGLFDSGDVIDMAFNAAGAMIGLAVAGRMLQRRRDQEEAPDPATDRLVSRRP
jgi:hypothetical protein